jgi:hypothetical protein
VSCESVMLSKVRGSSEAVHILEEGNGRERKSRWGRLGEQGQCWECTRSKSWHQNVRKNATHKESSGEVKEVSACTVVSGRGGAVLEHRNFC